MPGPDAGAQRFQHAPLWNTAAAAPPPPPAARSQSCPPGTCCYDPPAPKQQGPASRLASLCAGFLHRKDRRLLSPPLVHRPYIMRFSAGCAPSHSQLLAVRLAAAGDVQPSVSPAWGLQLYSYSYQDWRTGTAQRSVVAAARGAYLRFPAAAWRTCRPAQKLVGVPTALQTGRASRRGSRPPQAAAGARQCSVSTASGRGCAGRLVPPAATAQECTGSDERGHLVAGRGSVVVR